MNEIIILDNTTVLLITESGSAKWGFETPFLANELYKLLELSSRTEKRISELVNQSL